MLLPFIFDIMYWPPLGRFSKRAAVVHLNFRAVSTFPALVCTVPSSKDRTSRSIKVDAVRLYASWVEFTFSKGAEVRVSGII